MNSCTHCAVIGGGTMGRQIALNNAIFNCDVTLVEPIESVRKDLCAWADEYLAGRIAKGRLSADQVSEIKQRFHVTDSLAEACANADIVIEAIIEQVQAKRDVLAQISQIVRPDTLIVTNSSFMVSSTFKDTVSNPQRLANFHYFAPALVMKLVEVVQGEHTSEDTIQRLMEFARATGKTPVLVRRECDGFIVNNILKVIKEEAYRLVNEDICSLEDLDTAVELGLGHPMGPFKIDDLNGLDNRYNVLKRRYEETGVKSNGYDMIEKLCQEGRFGKKTKAGFYDYQ